MKFFDRFQLSFKIFCTMSTVLFSLLLLGDIATYVQMKNIITAQVDADLSKTVMGVMQTVEKSASLSIRSYLRAIAEQYTETANYYYQQSLAGKMTKEEAQRAVARLLTPKKIGTSGYLYVLNSDGIVKIHPKADVTDRNVSEQGFVKTQIAQKNGYLEYQWKNPEDNAKRKKVLYMAYFEPWDWIISATAYSDELAQLVQPKDFRDEIIAIKIMDNGYPFVLDLSGNMLVHPTIKGNVFSPGLSYEKIMKHLVATKHGKLFYNWTDPVLDGKDRKKVVLYDTIEQFGWIVGATGYVDEFYSPLTLLRNTLIILLAVGLVLSFLFSYFISKSIALPLKNLIKNLSAHSNTINFKNFSLAKTNEIEKLTAYCSGYIDYLKENNEELEKLYSEQKENSLNLSIFKEVFDNTVEGISITDSQGKIVLTNPAFTTITGYTASEALGQNPRILKSTSHTVPFYDSMWKQIREQGYWSGELYNKRKNGEEYPEWLTISAIKNKSGEITHYAGVFNDISTMVEQQEKIHFLAYHDHLTALPNRQLILDKLKQLISECRRSGEEVVCMVIDIDNFKAFNNSMGQEYGNQLLKSYVNRQRLDLREQDILGRIGGDDFALLFTVKQTGSHHIMSIIDRLFKSVDSPFDIAGHKIHLNLHIGIAVFPNDADTSDDIFKRANLALHKTKQSKGNSYSFFNILMEKEINNTLYSLERIRNGIKNEEFIPYFQPKVDLITGEVRGMEALARWKSDGVLVNPADFIPLSEKTGLIIPISKQIYQKAFKEALDLQKKGHFLNLSVNLSPVQFLEDSFIDDLLTMQKDSGLSTNYIELEITESILLDHISHTQEILETLAGLGFAISIDDFGTGYSSLQYLKQLPLNTLKIDMSFVSGIGKDKNDEKLVQTITLLAKQFGLKIVAEGVERVEQIEFLRNLGCEDGQGYFFGKPMNSDDFLEWLEERKTKLHQEKISSISF